VSFNIDFNYFADTRNAFLRIRATRVAWATMKGIDLAVLELEGTLGDLAGKGLKPHPLAAASPLAGAPVWWAGMPSTFIPPGESYLRRGTCSAGGITTLIEARWLWYDQIRSDCPDAYGGASGSPLFDSSGSVAGIIGTTTSLSLAGGPDYDCYQNRPCAVTGSEPLVEPDTSYSSPVAHLAACFNNGVFSLSGGCPLDNGVQLIPDAGGVVATMPEVDGHPPRWNVRLTGDLPYYAWKQVPIAAADCRDPNGYSQPIALASAPVITADLDRREGDYLLCVVAGPTPAIGGSWQPFRNPAVVRRSVDAQPLIAIPDYSLGYTGLAYRLTFNDFAPAVGLAISKRGNPGAVDCYDSDGYRPMISVPPVVFPRDFPHRICVWLADKAGNQSPPMQFDFGPPALVPFPLSNTASHIRVTAVAPGSLFRVDAIELTSSPAFSSRPVGELSGIRADITDSAGVRRPVLLNEVHQAGLGALMPAAALGPARLVIRLPDGKELPLDMEVGAVSPGIFAADFSRPGPPLGYLDVSGTLSPLFLCGGPGTGCRLSEVSWDRSKSVELFLYGTGFGPGPVTAKVGSEVVEVLAVESDPDWPGITSMRIRLPSGFGLRGYQILQVGKSARLLLLR
jgi:hypothetical protein